MRRRGDEWWSHRVLVVPPSGLIFVARLRQQRDRWAQEHVTASPATDEFGLLFPLSPLLSCQTTTTPNKTQATNGGEAAARRRFILCWIDIILLCLNCCDGTNDSLTHALLLFPPFLFYDNRSAIITMAMTVETSLPPLSCWAIPNVGPVTYVIPQR
jgi:hypothetical protein